MNQEDEEFNYIIKEASQMVNLVRALRALKLASQKSLSNTENRYMAQGLRARGRM